MIVLTPSQTRYTRDKRQGVVKAWIKRVFGLRTINLRFRAERVLEEALELAQAAGYPQEKVAGLTAKVYANPPGALRQEVGGLGISVLALCETAGISADERAEAEIHRVLSKSTAHFKERIERKIADGVCSADLLEEAA
jgi:NTP pyrophosphatase (non-canonical NTP hydrolase)